MNPYLTFGLAMCVIVLLALAGTSYMAVYFNRRAKQDLENALSPMADLIDGTFDLDEATIEGWYQGHITEAEVALRPGGMGRVFHVRIFDGAGGEPWQWTVTRSKKPGEGSRDEFESGPEIVREGMTGFLRELDLIPDLQQAWFRVEYDPEAGHIQLVRPMKTRRDVPGSETFAAMLEKLKAIADQNRALQGPERHDQSPALPGTGNDIHGREVPSNTTGETE